MVVIPSIKGVKLSVKANYSAGLDEHSSSCEDEDHACGLGVVYCLLCHESRDVAAGR